MCLCQITIHTRWARMIYLNGSLTFSTESYIGFQSRNPRLSMETISKLGFSRPLTADRLVLVMHRTSGTGFVPSVEREPCLVFVSWNLLARSTCMINE